MGGGYKKEMCSEKDGVHKRPWEVEFKQGSCRVRGDIITDVEAMGGGGSKIRFCNSHGRWRYGGDGGDVPSR